MSLEWMIFKHRWTAYDSSVLPLVYLGSRRQIVASLVMAHGTTLASKACVTGNEGTEIWWNLVTVWQIEIRVLNVTPTFGQSCKWWHQTFWKVLEIVGSCEVESFGNWCFVILSSIVIFVLFLGLLRMGDGDEVNADLGAVHELCVALACCSEE
jgi:hypothetical protein